MSTSFVHCNQTSTDNQENAKTGQFGNVDDMLWLDFYFNDAVRQRKVFFDQLLKPLHITHSQGWVLFYLATQPFDNQAALADAMCLSRASLNVSIDKLERAGLVIRRADCVDRRSKRLCVTPRGRMIVSRLRTLVTRANSSILERVTNAEIENCLLLLRKQRAAIERLMAKS